MTRDMPGKLQRPPRQRNGGPGADDVPRLTKAEQRVLQAIVTRIHDGRGTTIESICRDLKLKSSGGVHQHREKLVNLRILKRTPYKAGVELEPAWKYPDRLAKLGIQVEKPNTIRDSNPLELAILVGEQGAEKLTDMPVFGSSAAGPPLLVQASGWSDNVEQIIRLPEGVVGDADYLVQVEGDSMIEAGIIDGDVVFVRAQDSAESGEIVLALVQGEEQQGRVTIKRLVFHKGHPTLESANPNEVAFSGADAEVRGKVVGVLHWYERAPWRRKSRTRPSA
jgi:repressor LexA